MENEEVKLNTMADKEADTVFNAVVAASLRTLFWIFLVGSLAVSSLSMCLPYNAMQISYNLAMYKSAFAHAERAVKATDGEKRINALLKGIELSDKFLTEEKEARLEKKLTGFTKNEKKYAQKLLNFTEEYALSGQAFEKRNKLLDEYYNKYASTKYQKVLLFSNKNYVYCQNFKAAAILNQADKMLYNGGVKTLEGIAALLQGIDVVENIDNLAIIYNQISAYCRIDTEFKILCDQTKSDPFYFYVPIIETVESFLEAAKTQTQTDLLKGLYLVDSAANLEYTLKQFSKLYDQNTLIKEDLTLFTIDGLTLEKFIEREIVKL